MNTLYSEQDKQIAKIFITEILPLTLMGMIFYIMGVFLFGGTPSAEFIARCVHTGISIWVLAAWYYVGKGFLLIANKIVSRFTSVKRIPEETQ